MKVLTRKGTSQVLSATIVARHAGRDDFQLTLAMVAKVSLGTLASVIHLSDAGRRDSGRRHVQPHPPDAHRGGVFSGLMALRQ